MAEKAVLFSYGFLSFLPPDNDGMKNAESEAALEVLNEDLSTLLRLPDVEFWNVVKAQPSLHGTLDTYLRFRRRSFDASEDTELALTPSLRALARRILFLMMRLVTVPEKSRAAFRDWQAEWLYDQWIIDVPKIFDLCVLYGRENPQLMQSLLQNLFQLQPKWLDDFQEMVPTLVDNLYLLQERCNKSIDQIRRGDEMGVLGWTDVLKYLLDVCINVISFLDLFPSGGSYLMQNKGSLLSAMSTIHDTLLPQFDAAVRKMSLDASEMEELLQQVHLTLAGIQKTAFMLLKTTYLMSDLSESEGAQEQQMLADRGEQFMNTIMSFAQLDEHDASRSLLHRINLRFRLGDRIIEAIEQGSLSLDDAQFDYLSMLVDSKSRPETLRPVTNSTKTSARAASGQSSSQTGDDMQRALLLSKIREIKEVLPNHGDGFLERCLKEFDMNPEKVIEHLLDGSLPPSLANLDPHMQMQDTYRSTAASSDTRSSISHENRSSQSSHKQSLFPDSLGPGWHAKHIESPPKTANVKDPARENMNRSRKKVDRSTAHMLDQAGSEIRQIVIRQANELLADEYDDEYDDSFDDLGGQGGADGQADVEGDDNDKRFVNSSTSSKPYYVKDGKIYNAPRDGAVAVSGLRKAQTAAVTRQEEVIHGLGRGGNAAPSTSTSSSNQRPPKEDTTTRGRARRWGRGRGRNESHFRKERNLKKQGL